MNPPPRILDLHGTKHVQVLQKLEDFYLWKGKNTSSESIIVTGDSVVMREIAMDFLDKYDFKYVVESSNRGRIRVMGGDDRDYKV